MKGTKAAKLLCFGMADLVAFPTVPQMTVQAEEVAVQCTASADFYYRERENGTLEIAKYTGSDTKVTIPAEISEKKVTSIGNQAFQVCRNITSIILPNSLERIEELAFQKNVSV